MKVKTLKLPHIVDFSGTGKPLAGMMALSLLLHAAAFAPFLSPRAGSFSRGAIAYLDLNMEQPGKPLPASPASTQKVETPPPSPAVPGKPSSELDKLLENSRKTVDSAAAHPEAIQEGSIGLGMTDGYFASIGEGDTLRDDIREYYFEMLRRINEKWWLARDNRQRGGRSAVFYLVIDRNGKIVDRMLMESSGNPACDRAMLQALEAASPLPPLPETYRGDYFQAPLRFNMPLNLLGQSEGIHAEDYQG